MFRKSTIVFAYLVATPAVAAPLTAASHVDAVTVFPDQAQVRRSLTVTVPEGEQTVLVTDLPLHIPPESLRVEAEAGAEVRIGSVDLRDVVPPPVEPRLSSEAEQHIASLQEERGRLEDTIAAAEARRKLIERLGQAATDGFLRGIGEGKTTGGGLKDAWAAFGDGIAEALATVRTAHARQAAIDTEILRIRATLPRDPQATAPHGEARLSLSAAAGAGPVTVHLSYRMARAGWQPVYDARLSLGAATEKPALALVTRALVRQETGEDWTDVALTLSTARPARGTAAPDLRPMVVQVFQPPMVGLAAAPVPSVALNRAAKRAEGAVDTLQPQAEARPAEPPAAPPPRPAEEMMAQVDSGPTAVFHIPGRTAVETGAGARSVKVSEVRLEPQLSVFTVPKQVPIAFLTASFRPQGEAALLPGRVSIYRNDQFVGTGQMPFVAAGDDVRLGFGEDDRVKVERSAVRQSEGETGTFSTSRVESRDFRIRVRNLHDRPIPVTVEDQIPVSESTDVVVEKLPTMTPPTRTNAGDRRGVLAWSFDLKPGEDKEIRVGWRLKYPADRMIGWQSPEK